MSTVLNRSSRNFLRQHPWQLVLAIIGIALGVAVVISIDLAVESSLRSFQQAGKIFSGNVSHRIIAADGGLDENLYTRLRVEQGIQNLSPVVQGYVRLTQDGEDSFKIYGIDPLIEKTFQSAWQTRLNKELSTEQLLRLISEPNTVLLAKQTALQFQLDINDSFSIVTDNGKYNLKVIGLLQGNNALEKRLLQNLIITDIATAQEVLAGYGKLSSIEVHSDPDDLELPSKITKVLPANALLLTPQSQVESMRQMTRAFSINLTALGLLSLLVGMFLIYNTMTFLVLQRRRLIGSLRCIGVTRRQIFKLILFEAGGLAITGTAIGIVLGIILGQGILQLISGTINAIYFRTEDVTLLITPWQIGKGIFLGFAATLLAVLAPAWEATRGSPATVMQRSQLETGTGQLVKTTALFGIGFITGGVLLAMLSGKSVSLGLAGIFLLLFGFALLIPVFTLLIMKFLERLAGRYLGILGRLPPRMVSTEISRTGIAIAALMIAVSATIGMDLMIGSFRQTVASWIQTSLRADLYVSVSGNTLSADKAGENRQLKEKLAALPDVDMLSSVLHTKVIVNGDFTHVAVFELNTKSQHGFIFKKTASEKLWRLFEQQPTVIVTEAYAYFHGLKVAQTINLLTPDGVKPFAILGIYTDYSGDQGHIAMSRNNYLRYWPDLGYSGIGIYARTGTDLKQLQNQVAGLLAAYQTVRSDSAIYEASMEVFEQTFTITETLRWLAAAIAFAGVFSALMALQFERVRQMGILRAIGVTPKQLTTLIVGETGLMGLVAGLFAVPVGYIIAYVLIFVIYQRSFGWTMVFYVDASVAWLGLLLAFVAALLAGILPALKMSHTQPAEALRTE